MSDFDYSASAELFPTRGWLRGRRPFRYQRFDRAAEAIRFAMETLPPQQRIGACLEIAEQRFGTADIRRLYESADYPLTPRCPRS